MGAAQTAPHAAHRLRRIVVRVIGVVTLVFAIGFTTSIPTQGWWHVPIGLVLYGAALGLLLSRWARRDGAVPGHPGARRVLRYGVVGVGIVSLVWATWLATESVNPIDPLFLSTSSACGSAVWPRRFVSPSASELAQAKPSQFQTGLADQVTASFASGDCGAAIANQRALALLFLQVGILLVWAGRLRPGVERGPPPVRASLVGRPWVVAAAVVVVLLVAGVGLAVHSHHDVTLAEETDRQAATWLETYPPRLTRLEVAVSAMVPAMEARDFEVLSRQCRAAETQASSLDAASKALPNGMGLVLADDLRAFSRDTDTAFAACVYGSDHHDWQYLKTHMRPALVAAAGVGEQIQKLAYYR